ncbi:MAG: amino acid permease [Actinomycetaceae bacterium]|nr:amino acid permease [Actinomycetaceae bacterium]
MLAKYDSERGLQRNLSNRHIQLIAIGGAIGTGLFMGSGKTISLAGPSVVVVYIIIGAVLFLVMRAMGELLLADLRYGTFSDFIADIVGPGAGFFTGWTYWLCWIVTGTAEVIAITAYVQYWWPNTPNWIPALATILVLYSLNALTVRAFGEVEFWFSMIKIIAIIALIIIGVVMVMSAFESPDGTVTSVTYLWDHGGFFPKGPEGFVAGFQIAVFAFVGIELVGTTAAETKDPSKSLPKAVNSIPVRILLFYVGALLAIMCVTPWNKVDPEMSPFVTVFDLVGLQNAASVVYFVVLTSAASSCNSGLYSTSRMMFGLSRNGDSPKIFQKLSGRHVPLNALILSCIMLASSIFLMYLGDTAMEAFTIVTTVASILFMFIWALIVAAYIMYRLQRPHLHKKSSFKLPGGLVSCGIIYIFIGFLLWALWQQPDTRQAMLGTIVWFILLGGFYLFVRKNEKYKERVEEHRQKREEMKKLRLDDSAQQ